MILIISPKNVYTAKRFLVECRIKNVACRILSVEELARVDFKIDIQQYSCLYVRNPYVKGSPKYISNIIKLAKQFKQAGKKVVDDVIASGHLGEGKWEDYQALKIRKIPIPKTLKTHGRAFLEFPYIAKWQFGMKAKGTFLIRSQNDFKKIPSIIPKNELMVQEYIEADYEYKVITVGHKALPMVLRFDFNRKSGRVDFYKHHAVNIEQVKGLKNLAEKASKVLGRELAKVDILQKGNKFYVLEVNRFPGFYWMEKFLKLNIAKEFVEYLIK
jgi:glutathione synthase/RimK-type ligase-like ATP-grasp enzyme